jgi:hypothetical protein
MCAAGSARVPRWSERFAYVRSGRQVDTRDIDPTCREPGEWIDLDVARQPYLVVQVRAGGLTSVAYRCDDVAGANRLADCDENVVDVSVDTDRAVVLLHAYPQPGMHRSPAHTEGGAQQAENRYEGLRPKGLGLRGAPGSLGGECRRELGTLCGDQIGVDSLGLLGDGGGDDDVLRPVTAHEFGAGRGCCDRDAGDGDGGYEGRTDDTRTAPRYTAQCNIGKASIE